MRNSIRTEIKTWIYSRRALLSLLSFVFIFSLSTFISYKLFSSENVFFLNEEKEAVEREYYEEFITSLTDLSKETNYNSEFLIADLKSTESNLHAINPEHALSYCIETGYFFFPLVMTILGALSVKADMSSNLFRVRISKEGKWNYLLAKQIVMFCIVVICVFIAIFIDYFVSRFAYSYALKKHVFSLIDVTGSQYANLGNNVGHISFFVFYILLFLEIGFCIAMITKSIMLSTLIPVFFFYILPAYKYSPLNVLANVFSQMCDFQGCIHFYCTEISFLTAVVYIAFLLIIPFLAAMCVYRCRSAYK